MDKEVAHALENKIGMGALSKINNIIRLGRKDPERKISTREAAQSQKLLPKLTIEVGFSSVSDD